MIARDLKLSIVLNVLTTMLKTAEPYVESRGLDWTLVRMCVRETDRERKCVCVLCVFVCLHHEIDRPPFVQPHLI